MDGQQQQQHPVSGDAQSLKEMLRSRRMIRNRKVCEPCRSRKVRCNKGHPCASCIKQGYPDLCTYKDAPEPDGQFATPQLPHLPQDEILQQPHQPPYPQHHQQQQNQSPFYRPSPVEAHPSTDQLGRSGSQSFSLPQAATPGNSTEISQRSKRSSEEGLLEDHSLVSTIRNATSSLENGGDAVENGVLPLLGATPEEREEIISANPQSSLCLQSNSELAMLFACYRDRAHPFQLRTHSLEAFEKNISSVLLNQHLGSKTIPNTLANAQFLGLLHSMLAAGAQFSDLPLSRRIALTQHHLKESFKLLHRTNYLFQPSLETLQTLIILSYVMANEMKPQAAWVLQGITIRIFQCLGLHVKRLVLESPSMCPAEARGIRLAVFRQDVLLSLTFERPCSSLDFLHDDDLPQLPLEVGSPQLDYGEALSCICQILAQHHMPKNNVDTQTDPLRFVSDFKKLQPALASHLRDPQCSANLHELNEYYALSILKEFGIATLCRHFVSQKIDLLHDQAMRQQIVLQFSESLRICARAFTRVLSIAIQGKRSWKVLYSGLTSLFLLSVMGETKHEPETRRLREEVIRAFCEGEQDINSDPSLWVVGDHPDAVKRVISSIQKLNIGSERRVDTASSRVGLSQPRACMEVFDNRNYIPTEDLLASQYASNLALSQFWELSHQNNSSFDLDTSMLGFG